MPRFRTLAAICFSLAWAGCSSCHGGAPRPAAPGPSAASGPGASETPAPKLTAGDLAPVLNPQGNEDAIPDRLVIELAAAAADPSGSFPHPASPRNVLAFEPKVDGVLAWTSPSTLTFTPRHGFAPGQRYHASLERLETASSGVIAAPAPAGWTVDFETPPFRFQRIDLDSLDADKRQLAVKLVFTGPVDASQLQGHVAFRIGGSPVPKATVSSTGDPHAVRALLEPRTFEPVGTVSLVLREGVRMKGQRTEAPAAQAAVDYSVGKPIDIKSSRRGESPSGHYVDVVCSDEAAGGSRYYYDEGAEESYQLSRSCLPRDDDAQEHIHFSPRVKFSVVPSGGGFRILGDFKRGSYAMRIDAGLRSQAGGLLLGSYDASFSFPARKPQVSFTSQGRYLPRSSWKSLPVSHLNVEQAKLTVRQVPPEDLVFWAGNDDSERTSERDSNVLIERVVPLGRGQPDVASTAWVDLSSMLPATTRGLLEIRLHGTGADGDAVARLVLTDLNLVAKRAAAADPRNQAVLVWALAAQTGEPLSGVAVKAVRKSGKVLAECQTRGPDGCLLEPRADDADPTPAFALIATRGDDLTYLKFADLKTGIDDAEVGGAPYQGDAAYRAAVYADRGVYRPGDTAHLVGVVRDRGDAAPKAELPVVLRLTDPKERTIKSLVGKTNGAGLVTLDWAIPVFADTGGYTLTALVAEKPIGSLAFHVEEFVPERMKVTATAEAKDLLSGDAAKVRIGARYLFGSTPAGAKVELSCRIEPAEFTPKENANLTYGVWHADGKVPKAINLGSADGVLDDKGQAELACPGQGSLEEPARVVATAAVFESGSGRTSQAVASVPLHPEKFYLGLSTGVQKAAAGKPIPVEGRVVDWSGATSSAVSQVELRLIRLEEDYDWSFDEDEGREDFHRQLRPVAEGKTTAPVRDGKFSASLTPQQDGEAFLVEARAGRARTDLHIQGNGQWYWAPGESRSDQTPRPQKPTWIALEGPAVVTVGEKAQVKAKLPYRGHALFTVETDHVLTSSWRAVEAGENSFDLALDRFAPNVYASVFLVKDPHLESAQAYLPDRAFGVRSITVAPVEYTQAVQLTAPKEVRSESKLTVSLELGKLDGPTWATVAAVDEGILQLTHFEPPEPLRQLFARRALGVETFETVGWSLLLPPGQSNSAGGDAEGAKGGRVQQVKPVALWSGLVPVPPSGRVTVSFDLPAYRGALRVMAVTVGPKRVGHADAEVLVRDPLVVQTTLPRFLYQDDVAQIPVFVSNLSGAPQQVSVSLEAVNLPYPGLEQPASVPAPVAIVGSSQKRLSLATGKDGVVVFRAKAVAAVGAATLRVTATAGSLVSHDQTDVPLLPAGPRTRDVQQIELSQGDNDVSSRLSGWVPTSERSTLWVTSNPYGDVLDHVSYLLHYPYG
ncbi:MAG: alpha-2-macroglobulin family protein [Myxococcales bacterium]